VGGPGTRPARTGPKGPLSAGDSVPDLVARTIMLIRHAEKPPGTGPPHGVTIDGVTDDESLTPRGWQRAGALVALFSGARSGPSALPVPTHLFASQVGPNSSSRRPMETLQPLAERLGLAIDTHFLKEEVSALATGLRSTPGVPLVAWEHDLIPSIVDMLLDDTVSAPQVWPDDRFDVTWVCEWAQDGSHHFRQVPQRLLSGDLDSVIERTQG